jgi:D-inositol-3-phosphate glycosyltransferase
MNVYVRELAAELGRQGVLVDVYTRDHGCALPMVKPIAPGARLVHVKGGPRVPLATDEVAAHVAEFAGRVDAFARDTLAGPYELVHAHYWLSGQAGLQLARRWGVPLVQMFHTLGHLKNRAAASAGPRAGGVRLGAEALLARVACRLVAATPAEKRELVRGLRARADRVGVVPCGVDLALFAPDDPDAARRRLGLAGTRPVVYAGRLEPLKGVDRLIAAVGALVRSGADRRGLPLRLVIVGGDGAAEGIPDGEGRRLTRLAADLGLDGRVEFRGPEPQQRLADYYSAAFAVAMPSAYESFGLVALEALACGAALVATPVGAVPAVVEDGVSGLFVEPGDVDGLAGALGALLADPALAARLRRNARAAVSGYTWGAVASQIKELYAELWGAPLAAEAPEEAVVP